MAANTQPIFVRTPVIKAVVVNNVATDMETGASSSLLYTAGANGARLSSISASIAGTTSQLTALVLFVKVDGVKYRIHSQEVPIYIPASATEARPVYELLSGTWIDANDPHLLLPAGAEVYVGVTVAVAVNFTFVAMGGEF